MRVDKQVPVASIAWYKLADLIARREREKALSVYRLLAHSFDDKAYALQLEGDILLAFEDPRSKEKHFQAATLYKAEKRWVDAVSLTEHMLSQYPEDVALLLCAVYCYSALDVPKKALQYADLFKKSIKNNNIPLDSFSQDLEFLKIYAEQKPWLVELLSHINE